MRFLRRFATVGAAVTVLDVGAVVLLARIWSAPLVVIDAVAVVSATLVSYWLHRAISYAAEPARRWYRDLRHYLAGAALAGGVDVAFFAAMTASSNSRGFGALIGPKALALLGAFVVRVAFYRDTMFRSIRSDQAMPASRPLPESDVRLSLVIPAFGEEAGIGSTLSMVEEKLGHLRRDGGLEILVVDDGSADDTEGAARRGGADVVVRLEKNRGKGAAVRAGMLAATGRTVAFTDADLSYSPDQVERLMEAIEEGWDVVVGSRQHTDTTTLVAAGRLREIGGRVINAFTSVVLLGQYRDTQCGLKAFRGDVAKVIFGRSTVDGFAFDVEVFHLVERFRMSLTEVPVELRNSSRSTVHVARDAARLMRDLFRIRARAHGGHYELTPEEVAALWGDAAPLSFDQPSRRSVSGAE